MQKCVPVYHRQSPSASHFVAVKPERGYRPAFALAPWDRPWYHVAVEKTLLPQGDQVARRNRRLASLDEIASTLRMHLPELHARFGVSSLGLFGSYVRGQQRPGSDLDVLVEFDETPSLFKFVALQNHLADLLGVRVDLVMRKALRPAIGRHILAELVPV